MSYLLTFFCCASVVLFLNFHYINSYSLRQLKNIKSAISRNSFQVVTKSKRRYIFSRRASKIYSKNGGPNSNSDSSTAEEFQRTKSIFSKVEAQNPLEPVSGAGGAGGSMSYSGLLALERVWQSMKKGSWQKQPAQIIHNNQEPIFVEKKDISESILDYDVIVCGGTLGIFYAAALQLRGFRVAVIERSKVKGRTQEWNISGRELEALFRLGIVDRKHRDEVLSIEFNPVRVGFGASLAPELEIWVSDILNLGVRPDKLISFAKATFEGAGGVVLEDTEIRSINIHPNGAVVEFSEARRLSARLILDAMGGSSPIARQLRGPVKPDGICIVVGSCASGYLESNNTYSDLIYANQALREVGDVQTQYFWEAFPAGSGKTDRTSYLFTYMDAHPSRPGVLRIFEDYWDLLPNYQGVNINELKFNRLLYGLFPTYRDSPLKVNGFSRLLPVGDASGIQSPLSFGGFGSLTRHLERVVTGVVEALECNNDAVFLDSQELQRLNPYMPSISAYWMFQKAMSVPYKEGSKSHPRAVLGTLINSFSAMEKLGNDTMRPFLQDVLLFTPLLRTLSLAFLQDPLTPVKIIPHVGIPTLLDFSRHFFMLGVYSFLSSTFSQTLTAVSESPWISSIDKFRLRRLVDAWKYGSGLDYFDHE